MNYPDPIQAELLDLSPTLAAISRVNVFSVPEGYFNDLPVNILQLVAEPATGFLDKSQVPSQSVPAGYFDNLADNIMSRIRQEENNFETDPVSSILTSVARKTPFTVPEGYFESLPYLISLKLPQPAKVVAMPRRGMLRMMAAALIPLFIVTTLFTLNKKESVAPVKPNQAVMAKAEEIIQTNSFEKELASLSDEDIESYLTTRGQDVNAALVASTTDNANLPSSEEYLLNDNRLDEYLNSVNLNN